MTKIKAFFQLHTTAIVALALGVFLYFTGNSSVAIPIIISAIAAFGIKVATAAPTIPPTTNP